MASGLANSVEMEDSNMGESGLQDESAGNGIIAPECHSCLLALPIEIKRMIYKEVLCQKGNVRISPYFRGKIECAILYTCREVHKVASEVLVRHTKFWFTNPSAGLDLFGLLTGHRLKLVKECHFDLTLTAHAGKFDIKDLVHGGHLKRFLVQLADLEFVAVGVTIMGPLPKNWFYTEFLALFQPIMGLKSLEHLGIMIGSLLLTDDEKRTIIDLLKGMFLPGLGNLSSVFPAELAYDNPTQWIQALPLNHRATKWVQTLPQDIIDETPAFQLIMESVKLLQHFEHLLKHAKLIDEAYHTVRIRIPQARVLAEQGLTDKYYDMAAGIKKTLDEYYEHQFEVQEKVRKAYEAYADGRQGQ